MCPLYSFVIQDFNKVKLNTLFTDNHFINIQTKLFVYNYFNKFSNKNITLQIIIILRQLGWVIHLLVAYHFVLQHTCNCCFYTYFIWLGSTPHQKGYMATSQLYWWRKISGTPPCIISSCSGHLSRTTHSHIHKRI